MRLLDAARFFDRTEFVDAYSPTISLFKGQTSLYDDSLRDGTTVVRKIMSVAPGVSLPARRCVKAHDEVFIVGGIHKDSFDGEVIREKYNLHRADGLGTLKTTDQALRNLAGTDLYASRLWVKDLKEMEISSKLPSFLNIYVASSETVLAGGLILLSGRWHLVRNTFVSAAGFLVCESDELPAGCLTTATYTSRAAGAYSPATDTVGAAAPASVAILAHRWQDDYEYVRLAADDYEQGDIVAKVSSTQVTTADAGDTFTLASGIKYKVLAAASDGAGAWELHCRRD
jgi:hypothetical protein